MIEHVGLAAGRWHGLSLAQQLGNVGSEFERALAAKDRGLTDRFERALTRMLELLDLTMADPRWRGLRRYFLAFALLARGRAHG